MLFIIKLFLTLLLLQIIHAREYCVQSSYVDIWCDSGYNCCIKQSGIWCCRQITHTCGDEIMSCKVSIAMILTTIGIVLAVVGSIVGCVIWRRRRTQMRIQQQQAISQVPKVNQLNYQQPVMFQQQPNYAQPGFQQQQYQQQYQQPYQQTPVQGMPVYEIPLQQDPQQRKF